MKEFAIYRGDKFEFMGTAKEICEEYKVKEATVRFWASKANKKRIDSRHSRKGGYSEGILAVAVEED